MLRLDSVNKYFFRHKKNEIHVIDNTSLDLGDKGLVAFLGSSGSGKTTLLNIIGGLDKFNNGSLYINDKKITKHNYYKMDKIRNLSIGYIFQDYKLIDTMTVYENIALVLKMVGIKDKTEIKKRVDYVLEATNMYRYRNRLANMLSGGERQRVGIARALVKNPDIILADEPTGNLDSKNSIEVMNIIKAISKTRLVILVTHEVELANFYADRILDIQDGKIIKDTKNKHNNDLDYRMDNKIYLKDFVYHNKLKSDNMNINIYSNGKEKTNINIVFKNGNIYIESDVKNVELVDSNSNIELVNEHYKKISMDMVDDYKFDLDSIDNNYKKKYSSIFNPITLLINGFRKVFNYTVLKKILLLGFLITGMFIVYSVSSIFATIKVDEEDFITVDRHYLTVTAAKFNVNDYNEFSKLDSIDYIIPGNSLIKLKLYYKDFYQSSKVENQIDGSLTSIKLINESDLIYGAMPTSRHEIVIDKMVAKSLIKNGAARYLGIKEASKLVGLTVYTNLDEGFKIVGITDNVSPSIYADESMFINLIANQVTSPEYGYDYNTSNETFIDYDLYKHKYSLAKGRYPSNDYEVIVRMDREEEMPLNKEINVKINDRKLVVVGYYDTQYNIDYYFVSSNTIKYNLISKTTSLAIVSKDEEEVMNYFRDKKMNIANTYELDKAKYNEERHDKVKESIIVSSVVIVISLIEIFLMIRSSFLSRIKEIGILRAIGVKKSDVIKLFLGEIIAITTLAGMLGIALMSYIIKMLTSISLLASSFVLNVWVVLISVILLYAFNIIVGLVPVINVLRHTPASILARHDID
nr:ABC transporter ATP-binding protein/permease [Bacilli bacterium]